MSMNKPIKTRRLKKADREADFFFMNGYDVDGISVWSVVVAEPPLIRQHFFQFVGVIALGFYWVPKRLPSFFKFLHNGSHGPHGFLPTRKDKDSGANGDSAVYFFAQAFGVCARPRAVF